MHERITQIRDRATGPMIAAISIGVTLWMVASLVLTVAGVVGYGPGAYILGTAEATPEAHVDVDGLEHSSVEAYDVQFLATTEATLETDPSVSYVEFYAHDGDLFNRMAVADEDRTVTVRASIGHRGGYAVFRTEDGGTLERIFYERTDLGKMQITTDVSDQEVPA